MESEKVKEIKEKLQEEIFFANSFGDRFRRVPTVELKNLLTLIRELESENEKLRTEKAKLDRELDKRDCVDYPCRLIEKEQLKQFAERLKEKLKEVHKTNRMLLMPERDIVLSTIENCFQMVDETLKEFLGK